jgi:hypothetical protein
MLVLEPINNVKIRDNEVVSDQRNLKINGNGGKESINILNNWYNKLIEERRQFKG